MTDIQSFTPLWGVWHISRQLGSGSFGDVYEAKRTDTGREYLAAVKHIPIPPKGTNIQSLQADGIVTDEASARSYCKGLLDTLTKEIDICYELKGHTNFVSYEDHMIVPRKNEIGYDVFIRMELLSTLPSYITQNGITVGGITKLCEDMCNALSFLEQKRIIHRDIKPANIFVSSSGDFKLGDFGVARHMEGLGSMSVKGTYNYMAPEILKGEAVGANSDVYSLGLVLYRLLNYNRAPFLPPPPAQVSFDEDQAALDKRLGGAALPPPARADLSLPLTNVVMRACEYEAARRFQSAGEMKAALQSFRETQPPPTGFDPDATVAVERNAQSAAQFGTGASQWNRQGYGMSQGSMVQQGMSQGSMMQQGSMNQSGFFGGTNMPAPAQQGQNKTMLGVLIGAISLVVIALLALVIILVLPNKSGSALPQEQESLREQSDFPEQDGIQSEQEMKPAIDISEIEEIISYYTNDRNVAVSVCDLSSGEIYSSTYADSPFVASGFYIPVYLAADYFGYSTGTYDLMKKMDNDSANTLIDLMGGFKALNETLENMGYGSTTFERFFGDMIASNCGFENYTTAREATLMLKEIYDMGAYTLMSVNLENDGISLPRVENYHAHKGQGIGNTFNVFVVAENKDASFAVSIMTENTGASSQKTKDKSLPIISAILNNINEQLKGRI